MSRVPADTVLLRFAVAAALALSLGACGSDDAADTASTPAAAPAATSPATTPPPSEVKKAAEEAKKVEKAADDVEPAATVAKDGAQEFSDDKKTASKASAKKLSSDELAAQMKKASDALKAGGFQPSEPLMGGKDSGALTVGSTTVAFYRSPRLAAQSAASFERALEKSPQFIKVTRKANRLYLMSLPKKASKSELAEYRKIRGVVNSAV